MSPCNIEKNQYNKLFHRSLLIYHHIYHESVLLCCGKECVGELRVIHKYVWLCGGEPPWDITIRNGLYKEEKIAGLHSVCLLAVGFVSLEVGLALKPHLERNWWGKKWLKGKNWAELVQLVNGETENWAKKATLPKPSPFGQSFSQGEEPFIPVHDFWENWLWPTAEALLFSLVLQNLSIWYSQSCLCA